jgi:histidinol-phosphate phosphatase family protein
VTEQYAVVVPSVGRPSLQVLLESLAAQEHQPVEVVVVDDRRPDAVRAGGPLDVSAHPLALVVAGGGRGPAAARNAGWRATSAPWTVLLDDDVVLPPEWARELLADLTADADAIAGRIVVPLPPDRRPTDWERNTAGLESAWWATADMALRRDALVAVGGFDERFPRAYREDADLAVRLAAAGYRLEPGRRHIRHPVRPADRWISLRLQRGNADDALMRALHGPAWRHLAQAPAGRFRWHATTSAAAVAALAALVARRPRAAATAALAWTALTADFARRRIAPGPRTRDEVLAMLATSAAIPPAAVYWRLRGELRHRRGAAPWAGVRAVLFDRDGTLVHDVPYNGDPALVKPVDGAADAIRRLRAAGLAVGLVTNQSGIARGLIRADEADAVNARVAELVGPFDTVQLCPHGDGDGCACRKPRPGMVLAAARELGVQPHECVVIGDIGADVEAARAAGARAVLVPTDATRPEEVAAARTVATTLPDAVDLVLAGAVR